MITSSAVTNENDSRGDSKGAREKRRSIADSGAIYRGGDHAHQRPLLLPLMWFILLMWLLVSCKSLGGWPIVMDAHSFATADDTFLIYFTPIFQSAFTASCLWYFVCLFFFAFFCPVRCYWGLICGAWCFTSVSGFPNQSDLNGLGGGDAVQSVPLPREKSSFTGFYWVLSCFTGFYWVL